MSIIVIPPNNRPQQQFVVHSAPNPTTVSPWTVAPGHDDPFEGVANTEYRVRLTRRVHGSESFSEDEEAIVIIEAETEDEAGELALRRARNNEVDWESHGDREYGDTDIHESGTAEIQEIEEH